MCICTHIQICMCVYILSVSKYTYIYMCMLYELFVYAVHTSTCKYIYTYMYTHVGFCREGFGCKLSRPARRPESSKDQTCLNFQFQKANGQAVATSSIHTLSPESLQVQPSSRRSKVAPRLSELDTNMYLILGL